MISLTTISSISYALSLYALLVLLLVSVSLRFYPYVLGMLCLVLILSQGSEIRNVGVFSPLLFRISFRSIWRLVVLLSLG